MRVLVTGTDGYIGACLGPYLRERGHEVVGLDTGFYTDGWLDDSPEVSMTRLRVDVRHVSADLLQNFDAVVHLAELSNDPLGQRSPDVTRAINHGGSVALAHACKAAGVRRFVYSSSCSVYGIGSDDFVTEETPSNPQTVYAECKVLAERDILCLADHTFWPTSLRNATAFGASPRMRFDVVLNNLAGLAWTTGRVAMTSDGTPWRPLVHVLDIAEAVARALTAPPERVSKQILNVGSTDQNYRVREIAEIIGGVFTGCSITFGQHDADNRSYRVSFEKIRAALPEFTCRYDAERGARELYDLFKRVNMARDTFEFRAFTRLKQLDHLIKTGQLDDELFWREES